MWVKGGFSGFVFLVFFSFSTLKAGNLSTFLNARELEFIPKTQLAQVKIPFSKHLDVRIGIRFPERGQTPIADMIFLHGYGDSFANHTPFYDALAVKGVRGFGIDLPGHGATSGLNSHLLFHSLKTFGSLTSNFEMSIQSSSREQIPLLIAGWSAGGLLATKMISSSWWQPENRKPSGLILFAPGIHPKFMVGDWGIITKRTLTRNEKPPYLNSIKPRFSFLHPFFGLDLIRTGRSVRSAAAIDQFPKDLPILLMTADEKSDRYVYNRTSKAWLNAIRLSRLESGVDTPTIGVNFPGAFHDISNEPDGISAQSNALAATFSTSVVRRDWGQCQNLLSILNKF